MHDSAAGPECDCPRDDDLGAILHRYGCKRAEWLDEQARRMRHGA